MKPIDLNDEDDCRAFGRTLADLLLSSLRSRTLDREYHDLLRTYDESMPVRLAFDGLLEGTRRRGHRAAPEPWARGRHHQFGQRPARQDRARDVGRRTSAGSWRSCSPRCWRSTTRRMRWTIPTLAPRPLTTPEVHQKIRQIIATMRGVAQTNGDPEGVALWELVDGRMSLETSTRGRNYKAGTVARRDRAHVRPVFGSGRS